MTDEEREAIRERVEKATPGPWLWNSYSGIQAFVPANHPLAYHDDGDEEGYAFIASIDGGPRQRGHGDQLLTPEARADADFIANAREDIPALLAEVERLRGENAALTRARDHADEMAIANHVALGKKNAEYSSLLAERDALLAVARSVMLLSDNGYGMCVACGCDVNIARYGYGKNEPHNPECCAEQARALVATHEARELLAKDGQ